MIRSNEALPNSSELQALGNWRRSLRTSGLQNSLALGLQKLQVLNAGDVHQNFCLQKLQALDQKHNLQRLGLFIRTSCLRVFRCFFGKSSEHADADDLLIRNKSSEALWIAFGLRMQLLMERLLLQSQNLLKHSAATLEYQN